MPKLKHFFVIPKGEKVTEKALCRVMITSFVTIVLCLNCLIGSTWAWYQTEFVNAGNTITIGALNTKVIVKTGAKETELESRISYGGVSNVQYMHTLEEANTYKFIIKNEGTIEGYMIVTFLDEDEEILNEFKTVTIYPEGSEEGVVQVDFTVHLDTGEGPLHVVMQPIWCENPEEAEKNTKITLDVEKETEPEETTAENTDGDQTGDTEIPSSDQTGGNTATEDDQTGGDTATEGDQTGGDTATEGDQTGGNNTTEDDQTGGDTATEDDQTGDNNTAEGEQTSGSETTGAAQNNSNVTPASETEEEPQQQSDTQEEENTAQSEQSVSSGSEEAEETSDNPGDESGETPAAE